MGLALVDAVHSKELQNALENLFADGGVELEINEVIQNKTIADLNPTTQ